MRKELHKRRVRKLYELFRGEVAKQKKIHHLTDMDISKMTGISVASIRAFMCGVRGNDKTADAIAKALGIER